MTEQPTATEASSVDTQVAEPKQQECCPTRNVRVFEPAVNLFRTADALYLEAELPGVDAANLSVDLERETMIISGTTQASDRIPSELSYAEWAPGRFRRSFKVGPQIDREAITADMSNGLLKLKLPLKPEEKPRKISINIEN